jgi:hypothetical protein
MSKSLTTEQRNQVLYHHIDPGFINYRLCYSSMPKTMIDKFNEIKQKGDDHWSKLANDHYLVDFMLTLCKNSKVKTLGEQVIQGARIGQIFCSTEKCEGAGDKAYDKDIRIQNRINLSFESDFEVILDYSTNHFVADTGKLEQSKECIASIIGQIREIDGNKIIVHPLVIGAPSYDHLFNQDKGIDSGTLMWEGWDFYEIFPEDIDEFSKVKSLPDLEDGEWIEYMKAISESDVKKKLCEIVQEIPAKDWGGEMNDLFASNVHQSGRRTSAAFVLKGPAKFSEMTMKHLGKNADQIFRLAQSPARLLIVQHSHSIGEAVRATLRAFSVSPHDPRHFCFIDGKDTYKILKAYDKLN